MAEWGTPSSRISKTAGQCCCKGSRGLEDCDGCSAASLLPEPTSPDSLLDALGPLEWTAVLVGSDSVNTNNATLT